MNIGCLQVLTPARSTVGSRVRKTWRWNLIKWETYLTIGPVRVLLSH